MKPVAGQGIVTRKIGEYWITWNANLHSIGELNPQNSAAGQTRWESYNRYLDKFLFGRRDNPIKRGDNVRASLDVPRDAFTNRPLYEKGNCYENAIIAMIHEVPPGERHNYRVVHGIVTGQGKIKGVRYGHAWIEYRMRFGNEDTGVIIAYDPAMNVRIPAEHYRALGNASNIKAYTFEQMRDLMASTKHCGPWDETISAAAHNRSGKRRKKNPGDEPLTFRRDHGVSERYIHDKHLQAERDGYRVTAKGTRVPRTFTSTTAYLNRPALFPVAKLEGVPGLEGEETFDRETSLQYLIPYMQRTGSLPLYKEWNGEEKQHFPFINAWVDGKWYINEGNHRIKVARMLGWKYIPLEIKWYGGGDIQPHRRGFTPEEVLAFDEQAHREGFSVNGFRGTL